MAYEGASCSKDQCKACLNFFGKADPATYDCAGQCGLCALCPYNPTVPECKTHCKVSIEQCTETCNHGKALCMGCKTSCGL